MLSYILPVAVVLPCPSNTVGNRVKYWQKRPMLSFIYCEARKKFPTPQNPSESMLTVFQRWITIFLRLEKIEPLCRPLGQFGRAIRGAGRIS
ncbi:hypothetical protein ACVDG5_023565 [Mesorhizobium sp. ORM6]